MNLNNWQLRIIAYVAKSLFLQNLSLNYSWSFSLQASLSKH